MRTLKTIMKAVICLALGLVALACVKLNPNTEGQIESALQAKKDAFKACYVAALEKNRKTKGKMTLVLKIDQETGKVTSASVKKSTIKDKAMKKCVSKAAKKITLPEPTVAPVEGRYDIAFNFE